MRGRGLSVVRFPSLPRKRESSAYPDWIPAFAGMTTGFRGNNDGRRHVGHRESGAVSRSDIDNPAPNGKTLRARKLGATVFFVGEQSRWGVRSLTVAALIFSLLKSSGTREFMHWLASNPWHLARFFDHDRTPWDRAG